MGLNSRTALPLVVAGAFCAGSAFVALPSKGAPGLAPARAGAALEGAAGAPLGGHLVGAVGGLLLVGAAAAAARRPVALRAAKSKELVKEAIPRPEDLLDSPKFPLFMGSTGGYMSKTTRERHAITWTAKDSFDFEMPTGGLAVMNKGENLCYFRKKEQCLALGKQLRKMKIDNYKIYRIKKDGTVVFMHPADGVFPEKVNKGRVQVNGRPHTVCQNPQPGMLTWTKYHLKTYEADALTTMFVRARLRAYRDQENLFPLPNPNAEGWVSREDWPEYSKKMQEKLQSL